MWSRHYFYVSLVLQLINSPVLLASTQTHGEAENRIPTPQISQPVDQSYRNFAYSIPNATASERHDQTYNETEDRTRLENFSNDDDDLNFSLLNQNAGQQDEKHRQTLHGIIDKQFRDLANGANYSNQVNSDSRVTYCTHNGRRYASGQLVAIDEQPCLNCTCQNAVLQCYLRVCPPVVSMEMSSKYRMLSAASSAAPSLASCRMVKEPNQCCPTMRCDAVALKQKPSGTEDEIDNSNNLPALDLEARSSSSSSGVSKINPVANSTLESILAAESTTTTTTVTTTTVDSSGDKKPAREESSPDSLLFISSNPSHHHDLHRRDPHLFDNSTSSSLIVRALMDSLSGQLMQQMGVAQGSCLVNNSLYLEGSAIMSDKKSACNYCYCIREKIMCVKPKCHLFISGCTPNYASELACCPTSYSCSQPSHSARRPNKFSTDTNGNQILAQLLAPVISRSIHQHQQQASGSNIDLKPHQPEASTSDLYSRLTDSIEFMVEKLMSPQQTKSDSESDAESVGASRNGQQQPSDNLDDQLVPRQMGGVTYDQTLANQQNETTTNKTKVEATFDDTNEPKIGPNSSNAASKSDEEKDDDGASSEAKDGEGSGQIKDLSSTRTNPTSEPETRPTVVSKPATSTTILEPENPTTSKNSGTDFFETMQKLGPLVVAPTNPAGCMENGRSYAIGEQIPTLESCKHCFCGPEGLKECKMVECSLRVSHGCKPVIPDGHCCPIRFECPPMRAVNSTSSVSRAAIASRYRSNLEPATEVATPSDAEPVSQCKSSDGLQDGCNQSGDGNGAAEDDVTPPSSMPKSTINQEAARPIGEPRNTIDAVTPSKQEVSDGGGTSTVDPADGDRQLEQQLRAFISEINDKNNISRLEVGADRPTITTTSTIASTDPPVSIMDELTNFIMEINRNRSASANMDTPPAPISNEVVDLVHERNASGAATPPPNGDYHSVQAQHVTNRPLDIQSQSNPAEAPVIPPGMVGVPSIEAEPIRDFLHDKNQFQLNNGELVTPTSENGSRERDMRSTNAHMFASEHIGGDPSRSSNNLSRVEPVDDFDSDSEKLRHNRGNQDETTTPSDGAQDQPQSLVRSLRDQPNDPPPARPQQPAVVFDDEQNPPPSRQNPANSQAETTDTNNINKDNNEEEPVTTSSPSRPTTGVPFGVEADRNLSPQSNSWLRPLNGWIRSFGQRISGSPAASISELQRAAASDSGSGVGSSSPVADSLVTTIATAVPDEHVAPHELLLPVARSNHVATISSGGQIFDRIKTIIASAVGGSNLVSGDARDPESTLVMRPIESSSMLPLPSDSNQDPQQPKSRAIPMPPYEPSASSTELDIVTAAVPIDPEVFGQSRSMGTMNIGTHEMVVKATSSFARRSDELDESHSAGQIISSKIPRDHEQDGRSNDMVQFFASSPSRFSSQPASTFSHRSAATLASNSHHEEDAARPPAITTGSQCFDPATNRTYQPNETFSSSDPCRPCRCVLGRALCVPLVCPERPGENCREEKQQGQCCPTYLCGSAAPGANQVISSIPSAVADHSNRQQQAHHGDIQRSAQLQMRSASPPAAPIISPSRQQTFASSQSPPTGQPPRRQQDLVNSHILPTHLRFKPANENESKLLNNLNSRILFNQNSGQNQANSMNPTDMSRNTQLTRDLDARISQISPSQQISSVINGANQNQPSQYFNRANLAPISTSPLMPIRSPTLMAAPRSPSYISAPAGQLASFLPMNRLNMNQNFATRRNDDQIGPNHLQSNGISRVEFRSQPAPAVPTSNNNIPFGSADQKSVRPNIQQMSSRQADPQLSHNFKQQNQVNFANSNQNINQIDANLDDLKRMPSLNRELPSSITQSLKPKEMMSINVDPIETKKNSVSAEKVIFHQQPRQQHQQQPTANFQLNSESGFRPLAPKLLPLTPINKEENIPLSSSQRPPNVGLSVQEAPLLKPTTLATPSESILPLSAAMPNVASNLAVDSKAQDARPVEPTGDKIVYSLTSKPLKDNASDSAVDEEMSSLLSSVDKFDFGLKETTNSGTTTTTTTSTTTTITSTTTQSPTIETKEVSLPVDKPPVSPLVPSTTERVVSSTTEDPIATISETQPPAASSASPETGSSSTTVESTPSGVPAESFPESSFNPLDFKVSECDIYGRTYKVGQFIEELSNSCKICKCTSSGVECEIKC